MQKKLRLRFSLLTVLFVMTIVALASVCWTLRRQLNALHSKVAELEGENLQLRNQAGLQTIRDRTKLHAIESPYPNQRSKRSRERVWRIWIPEGRSFELHIATGWYSSGEFPEKSPKGPIILNAGEHRVRTTMMNSSQSSHWYLQLATNEEKRALNARWLRWEDAVRRSRGVPQRIEVSNGNESFLLWSLNVQNSNNQARDGMIVWLKPVSE